MTTYACGCTVGGAPKCAYATGRIPTGLVSVHGVPLPPVVDEGSAHSDPQRNPPTTGEWTRPDWIGLGPTLALRITTTPHDRTMTMNRALSWIPRFLSSKTSIIIGVVMFLYLVVLGAIATFTGHTAWVPDNAQLILGNYTNVLSMIGAGVAAGASHKAVQNQRRAHEMHQQTHELLTQISDQLDTTASPDAE